jgi:adenylyltransferase/sulfurtransferase
MHALTNREIDRYQRQLALPEFGEAAQCRLKHAAVLVVGAGGLGCPVLQYLAAAGVGNIGIMDDDAVSRDNLHRQILYTEEDIGKPKAPTAAKRLVAMNPDIQCHIHLQRFSVDNALDLCRRYDLVVDGSDNFPTRYLVNDACVLTNTPFIYGAIQGFQGQAAVFNYQGGPTYRCLYPSPPNPEDAPNCSEQGVLGILPGLIGMVLATEALKLLTGIGHPLSGSVLLWDALQIRPRILRLARNPASEVRELRPVAAACKTHTQSTDETEIAPEALESLLASSPAVQLIDVRETWERRRHKLDSLHIPLAQILSDTFNPTAHGLHPNTPILVYCQSGTRSLLAVTHLQDHHGFTHARSLAGGIGAWAGHAEPSRHCAGNSAWASPEAPPTSSGFSLDHGRRNC